jgi:hypothetical protein
MKMTALIFVSLLSMQSTWVFAKDTAALTSDQLRSKVSEIDAVQNPVMGRNSTVTDIDWLFTYYTDDFTHVHRAYGGLYTGQELYDNTVKNFEQGRYTLNRDRNTILRTIRGRNAITVER